MKKPLLCLIIVLALLGCGKERCNQFEETFINFNLWENVGFKDNRFFTYKEVGKGDFEVTSEFRDIFQNPILGDCPQIFKQFWEITIEDFNNLLLAIITINGTDDSNHKVDILLSSRSADNNTNNLFEIDLNEFGDVLLSSNQIFHSTYIINGKDHFNVLEITRAPRLPGSDLVEVTSLFFNMQDGILKFVREDGVEFRMTN